MSAWPSTPAEKLTRLFRGFWVSQAIYVAARLGLADLVADGPRSVADLASATGAHAPRSAGCFGCSPARESSLRPMTDASS